MSALARVYGNVHYRRDLPSPNRLLAGYGKQKSRTGYRLTVRQSFVERRRHGDRDNFDVIDPQRLHSTIGLGVDLPEGLFQNPRAMGG